ncbi:MAG: hypothetical protein LBJ12_07755 [Oscillospiraceae bacterium]|jgi:dipicolinate synthase subunit A|nr:hypothetical protein [Oscillospiraceae bacterium]
MEMLLLGGDRRMLYAAGRLSALGYGVRLGGYEPQPGFLELRFTAQDAWREAVRHSDTVVLPFFTRGKTGKTAIKSDFSGEEIYADEIARIVTPEQPILAGMPPEDVRSMFFGKGLALLDYFARDELAIANAVPTAQGVLALLIEQLEKAVAECTICVTGYGRCARSLARALRGLGTHVVIAARKKRDLAQIRADGYEPLALSELPVAVAKLDALVNTIPTQVITADTLAAFRQDCLLIEIASAPFGIDSDVAKSIGMPYIYAPSLPGKTAPKTAGEIIADTVDSMLRELARSQ